MSRPALTRMASLRHLTAGVKPHGRGGAMQTRGAAVVPGAVRKMATRRDAYKEAGIDTAEADTGLHRLVRRIEAAWPRHEAGELNRPAPMQRTGTRTKSL